LGAACRFQMFMNEGGSRRKSRAAMAILLCFAALVPTAARGQDRIWQIDEVTLTGTSSWRVTGLAPGCVASGGAETGPPDLVADTSRAPRRPTLVSAALEEQFDVTFEYTPRGGRRGVWFFIRCPGDEYVATASSEPELAFPSPEATSPTVRESETSPTEPSERPVFTRAISAPDEVNWSPTVVGTNILLALLLVILMPFPAALFNSTLGANYETIRKWFRLKPKPPGLRSMSSPKRWLGFGILLVITAALNSALDPTLGLNRRSLTFFLGLLASIAAVNLVGSVPDRLYMRLKYKDRPFVKLYPLALLVAVASVGISRLIAYRPGYLYGLIAGVGFSKALSKNESGWATLRTTAWMFLVSGIAWLAWIPVKSAVESNPDRIGLLVLDTTLAALFAAGISGNMFGLLPLKFLEGETLLKWNRIAWGLLFGFGVFTFLQTLIEHTGDAIPRSSIVTAAALFVGFGTISILFWSYFRIKNRKNRKAEPKPA
jgi:hypothetical protein